MLNVINRIKNQRGDTIVEVMISIAIVALAIAISYSISGKNLNVGVTARERNSAVGLVQGQIERMKAAQKANPAVLAGLNQVGKHFCFDADSVVQNDDNSIDPLNHSFGGSTGDQSNYIPACISDGKFYLDIGYIPAGGAGPTANGNSFMFTARWNRIGGGADQIVTIFYRPW